MKEEIKARQGVTGPRCHRLEGLLQIKGRAERRQGHLEQSRVDIARLSQAVGGEWEGRGERPGR